MEHFDSPALRRILERFPGAVQATHADFGDATAQIERGSLEGIMRLLRDEPGLDFEMLSDVTAVDWLGEEPRFELVYHLYSLKHNQRVRIKSRVPESDPEIASLVPLWPSADWMEREVWDLYGIRFGGHPDLRRILLYEEFEGHPLRKDYPKEKRQPLVGPRN
jgi:NADH-quinone oxidoreductase subunit C